MEKLNIMVPYTITVLPGQQLCGDCAALIAEEGSCRLFGKLSTDSAVFADHPPNELRQAPKLPHGFPPQQPTSGHDAHSHPTPREFEVHQREHRRRAGQPGEGNMTKKPYYKGDLT